MLIDRAVGDLDAYNEFRQVRDNLSRQLELSKSYIERYTVDYTKYLIKHPTVTAQRKFNALLLVKDLLKTRARPLVEYVDKKILRRLFLIASTVPAEACLRQFSREADPMWSAHFHYLARETLGMWAELFGEKDLGYKHFALALRKAQLLPLEERYWNFPSSGERERIGEQYAAASELSRRVPDPTQKPAQGRRGNYSGGRIQLGGGHQAEKRRGFLPGGEATG